MGHGGINANMWDHLMSILELMTISSTDKDNGHKESIDSYCWVISRKDSVLSWKKKMNMKII